MKKDLAVVVVAAIAGFAIAYFMTNLLYTGISNFSFKVLDAVVNTSISEPNPEVFNFRAVNPTVEVYVGGCDAYDEEGNCVTNKAEEDETTKDETAENEILEDETLENEATQEETYEGEFIDEEELINGGTN